MGCPLRYECKAYEAFNVEKDLHYLMWAFCHGEYSDCERYKRIVAGEELSETLLPTGEDLIFKTR